MKTKEKSEGRETKGLFPEMKKSNMTAIDRKIRDLLIAEGYRLIDTARIDRSGFNHDLNVNRMEYIRGERERVYLTTHKPARGKTI